jgi:hypothetical protein
MDNRSNLKKKKEKIGAKGCLYTRKLKPPVTPSTFSTCKKNLKFDTMNGDQISNTIQHDLTQHY